MKLFLKILRLLQSHPVLPIEDLEDSLKMGDDDLHTIPEKESNEFIKSSVEDLVLIPSEFEDMSDGECDLPFCSNSITFSNPFFDSNDDFTSSDDESLSDEDVPKDKVKIYSNTLFEFDDEYIFSDVKPLFYEVLRDIENKDSYVSNLDEPNLLATPLFDANEDECFDPGDDVDEIELLLHRDPFTPKMSEILYNALIDDLMTEDKVFDPGILMKIFSPTYVRLPFEDRHYFSLTYVIRIFLPYLTYSMDSYLPLSSGSEDTIFDPYISAFLFSSLEPVSKYRQFRLVMLSGNCWWFLFRLTYWSGLLAEDSGIVSELEAEILKNELDKDFKNDDIKIEHEKVGRNDELENKHDKDCRNKDLENKKKKDCKYDDLKHKDAKDCKSPDTIEENKEKNCKSPHTNEMPIASNSDIEEKENEEEKMLGFGRKVIVLYQLLLACLTHIYVAKSARR
uniref:Transmembrane and coiled-coil domain-containing protein 4-like n=1 Tax=Tanacetum cinerariifolium TaxID=118510 RepID=A0A6L2JW17_TANCI|nr:transmembrane and coiled-coil domain-containing protein 4-like [Tanacetum cinerariifolium]